MKRYAALCAAATSVAVVLLTMLAWLGGFATAAAAAPSDPPTARAWAGYPFLAGQVCRPDAAHPEVSAPLVAWHLGAGVPPAFLTSPVTANAATVSAAPPLAAVGPQSHGPVVPSPAGLADVAAIAHYAALLERYGTSGDEPVAEVAHAVMAAFGGAAAGSVSGCVDQAAEQSLLAQAADLAGPYALSFAARPGTVVMGERSPVAVTVMSASGKPVPGAIVRFTAAGAIFAGRSSQTSARTDAAGTAGTAVLVPSGTTATSIGIRAEVTVDTGLTAVTAQAVPTATNPSGAVTTAVYPADPVTAADEQQLTIDQTAHPVLTVSSSERAGRVGTAFTPLAAVSGMTGHAGTTTFTTRGPVPLVGGTLCASMSAAEFASAPALATSTAPVVGDRTVRGAPVQPARPGCYLITAALATVDAVPAASAQGVAADAVTVLDTTATIEADNTLIARAQLITGRVVVANLHATSATVRTTITGPRPIGYDRTGCAGVDYTGIRASTMTSDAAADTAPASDGGTAATSTARFTAPTGGIGCYRITVTLVVHVAGAADIVMPLAASSSVLSIDPTVHAALAGDTVTVQGSTVAFHIDVIAAFSQPAHVTVTMVPAAASSADCQAAAYHGTPSDSSGPAIAVPTTEFATVTAHSAPLGPAGCYLPVAVLTMDGNHAITATSTLDAEGALTVGPDLADVQAAPIGRRPLGGASTRSAVPAGIGFGVLAALAVVVVLVTALRSKDADGNIR